MKSIGFLKVQALYFFFRFHIFFANPGLSFPLLPFLLLWLLHPILICLTKVLTQIEDAVTETDYALGNTYILPSFKNLHYIFPHL